MFDMLRYAQFVAKPDVVAQGTIFGSAYAAPAGIDAFGRQATFDIRNRNDNTMGLRVTIARSLAGAAAENSNGFAIDITHANGDALDITFTPVDRTITGNVRNATALSAVKSLIDAETGLSSEYYGGETGTGRPAATHVLSAGGQYDRPFLLEIRANGNGYVYIGSAAPTVDTASEFVRNSCPLNRVVPPGERPYLKRMGGTNVAASASLWIVGPPIDSSA